jgi:hypothetical protein
VGAFDGHASTVASKPGEPAVSIPVEQDAYERGPSWRTILPLPCLEDIHGKSLGGIPRATSGKIGSQEARFS